MIKGHRCFLETCFDRIKNQDEHYVDCGGSCKPCGKCTLGEKQT